MNKLGETNSDEWDKIKGWMGAANGKKDHPLVQEAKRAQRVQKFDEGSADVEPDAETMKFLQPQGAGLIAPSASQTPAVQPPPVQAPMPAPQAPVQPPPQMPPAPAPTAPAPQGQDSGSQVNQILGTSPQELQQFLQKVNTPNWRQQVGAGVTGLADAFSRAGGSNSDYERQYNERVQNGKEGLSSIPGKVADLGKEKFGLTQTLDAQNPNSPYSKTNQATYGPDLMKMGLSQAQINKMPASLIKISLVRKLQHRRPWLVLMRQLLINLECLPIQRQIKRHRLNKEQRKVLKGADYWRRFVTLFLLQQKLKRLSVRLLVVVDKFQMVA